MQEKVRFKKLNIKAKKKIKNKNKNKNWAYKLMPNTL